ncbi:hypothetical protein FNV43_RR16890 [Rhamnella rubrinervis]|uniref:Cytochrome b5 heme-binding domain-containing protein n=1 Tax=Rhamnella rubrinervis TaxID=2594499 RepID=A0A8K0MDW9_9ROSA|nr:hypothetical protein FNV43_RR16890 [Rhamnella rubrinervis]
MVQHPDRDKEIENSVMGHQIKRIFCSSRSYSGESAAKSSQLSVSLAGKSSARLPESTGRTKNENSNAKDNKASKIFNKAEVSLHNKRTDCWIIIKDKVYDVTSYVEEHPGGDAILAHAGDDSTEGFYGPQHATRVFDMIDDFYVGNLEH